MIYNLFTLREDNFEAILWIVAAYGISSKH